MNDESLDTLFRTRAHEQEGTLPPQWPAPDALWSSLNEKRRRKDSRKKIVWRVAAALLITALAAGYTLFFLPEPESPYWRRANLSPAEQDAFEFIDRHCGEKNISCSTPVMLELRSDLHLSFKKLEEIDQKLQLYGNDAELMRARARVENHQARIIKTIVQKL
jgi:hypothetical protein